MGRDQIGTGVMLAAAAWMASLAFTDPGQYAAPELRQRIVVTALVIVLVAFFPRRLNLTGTVLAVTALGLSLNIGLFGLFGMTWEGLLSAALIIVALWLRKDRLDNDAIVVISAAAAGILAVIQPLVILFALVVILAVNVIIWVLNRWSMARSR